MAEIQGFSTPGRVVTISNPYTEISMNRALELELQGNYEEALETFDQVLKIDPNEARAYHAMGDIYDLMGRYNDAVFCYDSALECDPFNADTLFNKGVTLGKMGRQKESDECISQGVSLAI
ncbi:MAG: hypothetical protein CVV33_00945 [Methanomicrobiales archaeon HGW-Methanomicrobiales-4]|nr:MAG: hypothetical protein CVV33_00945 [Methanomicrobiales archaeon HGW-Methanomicrobiales-4]